MQSINEKKTESRFKHCFIQVQIQSINEKEAESRFKSNARGWGYTMPFYKPAITCYFI